VIFTDSLAKIRNKVIAIDIDGTICSEEKTFERSLAKPIIGAVEAIKTLHENDNIIIFYTARGWEQYRVTRRWLESHGFIYDQLIMGKPIADIWIDDRARHFKSWSTLDV
jgi:uncharacterized HAD superfamily protein